MLIKVRKMIVPVILGAGYGFISVWWLLFSLAFAFPGTSPGSRDWEEDVFFIPIGYGMLIGYIIVSLTIIIQNRDKKKQQILFWISTLLLSGIIVWLRIID